MTNRDDQHIHDLLAAYALGVLDADEVAHVEAYLAETEESQAELAALRAVVAQLPYAAQPVEPPARVRRQLFARIAAGRTDELEGPAELPAETPGESPDELDDELRAARARPPRMAAVRRFLLPLAAAAMLFLFIGMGTLLYVQQTRMLALAQSNQELATSVVEMRQALAETEATQTALAADLALAQQDLDQLATLFSTEQQVFTFVTAPGVATRQLLPVNVLTDADGAMYMRPGQRKAVVLFRGLTPLEPGQVYQFWLADGEIEIAAGTVTVDPDGLARLWLEAPDAVNHFNEVMLTVESEPESPEPTGVVVLEGSL
jgi:anti-sigma factor RsiW